MNNKYELEEWRAKSLSIISRDNYTCQNENCHTFNPAMGRVEIISPIDGCFEFHEYNNNYASVYNIQRDGITLELDFGAGLWIVMPTLQVHHKRYIDGIELWDYDDKDLITLCKECHHNYHKNNMINVYDRNGNNIIRTLYSDVKDIDTDKYKQHNFKPWTFITKDLVKYSQSTPIEPLISCYILTKHLNMDEERIKIGNMLQEFYSLYLPMNSLSSNSITFI